MRQRGDLERARRVTNADPLAFEALFAELVTRVHAFAARRTPSPAAAQRVTDRVLTRVFSDLARYDGRVSLDAWALSLTKQELRAETRAVGGLERTTGPAPPPGAGG